MYSLPSGAEGLVGGADGQGEGSPVCEHLAHDIQIRATILIRAGKLGHRILNEFSIGGLLTLPLQSTAEVKQGMQEYSLTI